MQQRIMIIDDDREVNACFADMLRAEGYDVACAFNVVEAVELAGQGAFDMVVLDYLLPDGDGTAFLSHTLLKRGTKVLLVTGNLTRDIVVTMFKLGICGYLAKPVGCEELLHNVNFHLKKTNNTAYAKYATASTV